MDKIMHSHIFTNKNGNTLMREFEGVLSNKKPGCRCRIPPCISLIIQCIILDKDGL